MKPLLIFLCMLFCACIIDLKPVVIKDMEADSIHIIVKGAVENEENISLPLYSSIEDLLARVNLKENADVSQLNPATILKDHDIVTIPYQKTEDEKQLISINTATLQELCTLEGIGEGTAARIIEDRETNGLFQTLEDLMRVKGIGAAKFAKIKDSICL